MAKAQSATPRKPRKPAAKPYRKTTNAELEERVTFVARLLSNGLFKSQIKKLIREKYGVCTRTAEEYIGKARKELRKRFGKDKKGHQTDSYSMYRSVVADPNNLVSDRLKAQERIDKLLGLEVKEAGVGVIVNNVNAVGVAIDQTLQRLKDD
jgi:hypothetical protein